VRDDNPVLVLEAELLLQFEGMVDHPMKELLIPLGQAEVKREVAIVSIFVTPKLIPTCHRGRRSARGGKIFSAEMSIFADQAAR